MRKHLLLSTVLVFVMSLFMAQLALAGCGSCATHAPKAESTAAGSSCSSKGAASHASCGSKSAASHASCGSKGAASHASCAGKTAADCATACATKGASAESCHAAGDFFISHYMGLKSAMGGHCNTTKGHAAADWQTGLEKLMASDGSAEHREALAKLAAYLNDWPSDKKGQQARFEQISAWTAGYCEMFPEKTAGAKVVTCPTSGHRWVELEEGGEDSKS